MKMSRIKSPLIAALTFVFLFNLNSRAQTIKNLSENPNQSSSFQEGEKASANYFTGAVWVKTLVNDTTSHSLIARVTFEPGARSNWHYHPDKQILIITNGTGYYAEKGRPIQILHQGDVVTIQPNVEHWHGASPVSEFVQIVVNPNIENGVVVWLRKVTDEEYHNVK